MKNKKLSIIIMQISVIVYAIPGVFGKFASNYEFLSLYYIIYIGLELFFLGVYAIIWQQIIKYAELSVANINKATAIFWSLLFSFLIFKETINMNNVIGSIIIFIGLLVVNK